MFKQIPTRFWRDTAVAGVAFQVFHFLEHGLQLGYWFLHPTAAPWLTPWAVLGQRRVGHRQQRRARQRAAASGW